MGNLKTAALACGVVASVLGGGFGVAYITSSTVRPSDVLIDETDVIDTQSVIGATAANIASAMSAENATTYNRTTTKKSYTADNTPAASKMSQGAKEGTTSQRATEAATVAAQISRSVPAPAHAPAAITEPVTQAYTTAAKVENITSAAAKATTTVITEVVTTTTTTVATTTAPIIEETTPVIEYEEPVEEPEPIIEYIEEPEVIDVPVEEVPAPVLVEESSLPISDQDFILLCNAVANEAGSNWISNYDKACVVEVIMNRVNSAYFPSTIYNVLTQRNQFTGASRYVNLGTYSSYVTQSVKDAVTLYFSEPQSFTQGYLYFYGDGRRNYFY